MSNGMWQAQVGDREQWESERCENHPDRHGELRVDLPSIGIKRYLCNECTDRLDETLQIGECGGPTDMPQWEHELHQGCEDRRRDMLDAYPSQPLIWKDKK